eukprot:gene6378-8786_t
MGIYLSTPSTEIFTEEGNGGNIKYAVGEMQGWRKNMEDAHVAAVDVKFGENDNTTISVFGVFDGHGGKEVAKFVNLKYMEVMLGLNELKEGNYAEALRESFHKIDDLLREEANYDLLQNLRALPNPSDQRLKPIVNRGVAARHSEPTITNYKTTDDDSSSDESDDEDDELSSDKNDGKSISTSEAVKLIRTILNNASHSKRTTSIPPNVVDLNPLDMIDNSLRDVILDRTPPDDDQIPNDYNSNIEQILNDNQEDDNISPPPTPKDASEAVLMLENHPWNSDNTVDSTDSNGNKNIRDNANGGNNVAVKKVEPAIAPAAIETSNGWICNLKDHKIAAGCTAIVAMLVGKTLYIANAGDSRGVLCRQDYSAYQLSYDHKPQETRELKRITDAGGFVNQVGRINGNLNLSRSLGDLKYKQLTHLPREQQIITAEPDITTVTIEEGDRFFLLACDGVWDCMTCPQICDFVSERLDEGMTIPQIIDDIFHKCVSADPRRSAGIGGDNMTCLIVLLNQK